MKIVLTSDLHQWLPKWRDLVEAVKIEKPQFALIAGDLLPKEGGHAAQKSFFASMRRCFEQIKQSGPMTVLIYLGNDDHHTLEPLLDDLQADGLCVNLNGRVHREEGLIFCGMNKVRDYPFGYKHWCVPDGEYLACPVQYSGEGFTLNEQGEHVPLESLHQHLSAKPSIGAELARLKGLLTAGEMERSIWMIHQPPSGLGMDILGDGQHVGSPTVLEFIQDNQPLLGCSGHIHESPYMPGGKWVARVGRTWWIQPGQMEDRLHAVTLEVTESLSIANVRHSVFGSAGV